MRADLIGSIDTLLTPFIGLIFILLSYRSKQNSSKLQWRLLLLAIVFALANILTEVGINAVAGARGIDANTICLMLNTLYYVFQVAILGFMTLFLEYSTNKSYKRLQTVGIIIAVIFVVNTVLLVINMYTGFLFSISRDSFFIRGEGHFIRIHVYYLIMLLAIMNTIMSRRHMNKRLFFLTWGTILPTLAGVAIDYVFPGMQVIWTCIFIALLFDYLFIVQLTSLIDELTGVYNRRGCDEQLFKLQSKKRRKAYSFFIINVNGLHEINAEHGHVHGDNALRNTAEILISSVRRSDFIARNDSEMFVIIAATNKKEIIKNRINQKLQDFNVTNRNPYSLTLAFGDGIYMPDDSRTPQEFLAFVNKMAMIAQRVEHSLPGQGVR